MNLLKSTATTLSLLLLSTQAVSAAITNPATGALGGNTAESVAGAKSGELFVSYFVQLWATLNTVGALIVLVYFLWGAFEWLTSAGDSGKLQSARNRMLHAFIGLLLLVTSYTIIAFVSNLFFGSNFNILNPVFYGVEF